MESQNLDGTQAWRRKYFDSLGAVEVTEQRLQELEEFLYRSVSRLALGVYGLSKPLDRELDRLREAVKKRSDPEQISELALRVQECGRDVPAARALLQLMDKLEFPRAQLRPVGCVRRSLARVVDEGELEEVHTKLASILNESLQGGVAARQAVDALAGEAPLLAAIEEKLARILEQLPLSTSLRERAINLRGQLRGMDAAAAVGAVAEIAGTMREEIDRERGEVQTYLEELDVRLGDLGTILSDQASERLAATQLRERLDAQIGEEVDGMQRAVSGAAEVDTLRQAVSKRLASIKKRMASFVASEAEQRRRVERSEAKARERLQTIETESARLAERLEDMRRVATQDALTGCYNRAAFDTRIAEEFARWSEQPEPLSLQIWDIDLFKAINDTYGHPAGDKVLASVGGVFKEVLRGGDYVARWGGEEFIILLPGASLEHAKALAERLRERLARTRFVYQGQRVEVTASCGVAEFSKGDTPASVINRADRALYRAKAAGRNRVETGCPR
jgi:diguanylate cyclase